MRMLVWLLRAAIFFTLFAFALNNQQEAAVRWFFGQEWRAPMVLVMLSVFALGCMFGVAAMVPSWWRHRRVARQANLVITPADVGPRLPSAGLSQPDASLTHPPRDGL